MSCNNYARAIIMPTHSLGPQSAPTVITCLPKNVVLIRFTYEIIIRFSLKLILKEQYKTYENALEVTKLESLEVRRSILCKRFALKCIKNPRTSDMFPIDYTRHSNKFQVTFARNERLLNSAIPQMQRILNSIK